MWFGHKPQRPQRIPKVMQLLTAVDIPPSWLWREVWKRERRIVNFILVWAERQIKSLGHLSTMVTPAPTDQRLGGHTPVRSARDRRQSYQRPHPSSACILLSFVAKDQEDIFAVFARYKDLFYSLMLPYWEGQSFQPLQARKYEGSAMVFLNVILFPAQLCKLAVLPSLPSFLYTHSRVWRNVNHG